MAFIDALGCRARLNALQKQLEAAEIQLDLVEQKELAKSFFAGYIGDLHARHPELVAIIPTIQDMIERGIFTLDP